MGDKIMWSRQEEVEKAWVHEGYEYSHRLITKRHQGSSFSFHITTYMAGFETIVEGDGLHEVVLYCLHGWSRQIDLSDRRERIFKPGDAMYLPVSYRYRHIIGGGGLVVAVSCTPSREPLEV